MKCGRLFNLLFQITLISFGGTLAGKYDGPGIYRSDSVTYVIPKKRYGKSNANKNSIIRKIYVNSSYIIVKNKGAGKILLDSTKNSVSTVLGSGVIHKKDTYIYVVNYETEGIQISFTNKGNRIKEICFFNKDIDYEHFAVAKYKTDKGIDWNSSLNDIYGAYGNPRKHYGGICSNGKTWRRLVYFGIDFKFIDEKLVKISVSNKFLPQI